MEIWWRLTSFGDSEVLLPCALLLALWLLLVPGTRRTGWLWFGAVGLDAAVVALSKVMFLAWNAYPSTLGFTGLSGDCAMAFLCWPAAGAFTSARALCSWRVAMIGLGVFLGVIVAVSRVLLHAHTVAEVLLGSAWGLLLCTIFLYVTRGRLAISSSDWWMPLAVLALLMIMYGRGQPYNRFLSWTALRVSGHTTVYRRPGLDCRPKLHCSR